MDQMDLFAARASRDEAMTRVSSNAGDWTSQARAAFSRAFSAGWEGTGEDIRIAMTRLGVPQPHHHNAWGPFVLGLRKSGWLSPTGEWRPMRGEKSNARETKVYRRNAA